MYAIGNDIVDLEAAKLVAERDHNRYLKKICLPTEIDQILAAPSPHLLLWRIWSMKEAAYKAITQHFSFRAYIPKKLCCHCIDDQEGVVESDWMRLITKSSTRNGYVHSIATHSHAKLLDAQSKVLLSSPNVASAEVRESFKLGIAKALGYPYAGLSVHKKQEVPILYHHQKKIKISFSFSHHNNYAAWVFLPSQKT